MRNIVFAIYAAALLILAGCGGSKSPEQKAAAPPAKQMAPPPPAYFQVDRQTAGAIEGRIRYTGKRPVRKLIDMSDDPACVEAHHGKAYDESLVVNPNGTLANVFVYIKSGLEGKAFEPPTTPVVIDQKGCWFHPRVVGIEVGQPLEVINSDPVTHNIHPMAEINRAWNHSQGSGDPPIQRKFLKPEIMIPVKCNIHSWMHAFIGVVSSPYFAVTGDSGSFEIKNLPPGDYVIAAWQEKLGTQEMKIAVALSGKVQSNFTFKGE